jgi:lysophospholipase L1-like esterase
MKQISILLLALMSLSACGIVNVAPTAEATPTTIHVTVTPTATATPQPHLWRIMPMGDSLTEGDFPDGHHSYRGYLEVQLREAGYQFDFVGSQWKLAHSGTDYEHEGHGGFTIGPDESMASGWSANLDARLDYFLNKAKPDIILLLIGINDLFPTAQRPVDPAQADEKLAGFVKHILEIDPDAHIFVASLAPVNFEWTDYQPEYEAVNRMAEQIGNADLHDRIYFVDMNRKLTPTLTSADFFDGVHFSESGARKVARVWFEALQDSSILDP